LGASPPPTPSASRATASAWPSSPAALLFAGLGLAAALGAVPESGAAAETLRVDPGRSQLVVHTFKDGPAAWLGHDHVVQAAELTGTVEHDPASPEATVVVVEVPTASLRADDPALRRRLGLTGEVSASDRAEIEKAMRSADQLDVARFPTIRFASSRVTRQADGRLAVTGTLTIRGVNREVTFPAEVTAEAAGALHGQATLTLRQSSFGYQPYRAALGAIRNKDEVTLHVDLWAAP